MVVAGVQLAVEPLPTLLQDVGTVLLDRVPSPFDKLDTRKNPSL